MGKMHPAMLQTLNGAGCSIAASYSPYALRTPGCHWACIGLSLSHTPSVIGALQLTILMTPWRLPSPCACTLISPKGATLLVWGMDPSIPQQCSMVPCACTLTGPKGAALLVWGMDPTAWCSAITATKNSSRRRSRCLIRHDLAAWPAITGPRSQTSTVAVAA